MLSHASNQKTQKSPKIVSLCKLEFLAESCEYDSILEETRKDLIKFFKLKEIMLKASRLIKISSPHKSTINPIVNYA